MIKFIALQTAWFWFQIRSAGLPWGFLMHSPAVHGRWTVYFRQERMAKKRQTLRDISQNSSMFPWFILKIRLDTPTCTCNILRKLLAILRVGWESSTRNFLMFWSFCQWIRKWEWSNVLKELGMNHIIVLFKELFKEWFKWPTFPGLGIHTILHRSHVLCELFPNKLWGMPLTSLQRFKLKQRRGSWCFDQGGCVVAVVWNSCRSCRKVRQKNATSSPRRLRVNNRIPFESSTRHWKWWIWKGHLERHRGFPN